MAPPNKVPKIVFPELPAVFAQHYSQMIDTVNSLVGHNGPIELASDLNLGGKRVTNVGTPASSSDVITQAVAEAAYSASALQPQLQSNGKYPMPGYRILNSGSQREQQSSWLNDLMSTPPNSNAIYPSITNGTGDVTVSIPASVFRFADGSNLLLQARTDVLTLPTQYAISAISSSGNVVTVDCTASGLVAGQVATIAGVSPSSFNGTFTLTSSSSGGSVLQYQADLGTSTGSGGYVQVNGVYYYSVAKRSPVINLHGPYAGDTLENRLLVSSDGSQIVAVVVVTNSGAQIAQSGGGGSPITGSPTAGSLF